MVKPRFGVHIGIPEGTRADAMASMATTIEELGFDGVFVSDSFSTYHEPLSALAALAAGSRRISLGTCVYLLPQRHPIHVAKQAAFIQRISGGRLVLGLGVGWRDNEFEALELNYSKRGMITDESIAIMKMAWENGRVDFSGKWFKIKDVEINTRLEVQPKLWIGGNSESAMRRAVRIGDGWVPTDCSVQDYEKYLPSLNSEFVRQGRNQNGFELASHLMLLTSKDESEMKEFVDLFAKQFGSSISELKEWALVGSPSELVEKIRQYQEVGVTYHVLSVWGLPWDKAKEALEVFSTKVTPEF